MASTNWIETAEVRSSSRYFAYLALTMVAIVFLVILPIWIGEHSYAEYVSEGGALQVFSAAFYLIVTTTIVRESRADLLAARWHLALIPVLMCLRELDFHNKLTTMSITKTSFYVSPDVGLGEKLVGAGVLLLVGIAGYRTIKLNGSDFIARLRRLDVVAVAVAAAGASAVLSKLLDGAIRKLADVGIAVPHQLQAPSIIFEEVLELGIPVFLAIAAFAYFSENSPSQQGTTKSPLG